MSSPVSNARLVDLLRTGLTRADERGQSRVRLTDYSAEEQEKLLALTHAYLWDTAAPHDGPWHRSPGNIMTLWAELLGIAEPDRRRLRRLRTNLVKQLTERGLGYRTDPQSVPVLVREYRGAAAPPVHLDDPRGAGEEEEAAGEAAGAPWGAGYGEAAANREVELAAESVVRRHYEDQDRKWSVSRVAHLNCGWDLTATRDGQERHLEVKGVSGNLPAVLLTRNELRTAESDPQWRLAVVTDALGNPRLLEFDRAAVTQAAEPTVYRVDLSPRPS